VRPWADELTSQMLDLSSGLGSTALSLAKGPGFDDIKPAIFRTVLDGYVAGDGALPPPGPSWFVSCSAAGWGGLAGVRAGTGPDLALSHESVRNGVRGLPELFGRLPAALFKFQDQDHNEMPERNKSASIGRAAMSIRTFNAGLNLAGRQVVVAQIMSEAGHIVVREFQESWTDSWQQIAELDAPPPGLLTGSPPPTLARNPDGRLEYAAQAADGSVWHIYERLGSQEWSPWNSLGAPGVSHRTGPAFCTRKDGRLQLFLLGAGQVIWTRRQSGPGKGPWTPWADVTGREDFSLSPASPTVALNHGDDRPEVFAGTGEIWHAWQRATDDEQWTGWQSLGSPPGGSDAFVVAAVADGRLRLLVLADGQLWLRQQRHPGSSDDWTDWSRNQLPDPFTGLAAGHHQDGRMIVAILQPTPDGGGQIAVLEEHQPGAGLIRLLEPAGLKIMPGLANRFFTDAWKMVTTDDRARLYGQATGVGMIVATQTQPDGREWTARFEVLAN